MYAVKLFLSWLPILVDQQNHSFATSSQIFLDLGAKFLFLRAQIIINQDQHNDMSPDLLTFILEHHVDVYQNMFFFCLTSMIFVLSA
jgi:hypothetical protein